jgi:hypothetical protein
MLSVAVVLAYASSILAAFMSTGAGFAIIPHLNIVTDPEGLRELPAVAFQLDIPQIMPVMSALVFSMLRKVVLVAPLTLLLPGLGLGVHGVFWAELISQVTGASACFITMYLLIWRKMKENKSLTEK